MSLPKNNVKKGQESNCTIFETNYEKIIGARKQCTTARQDYQYWGQGLGSNSSSATNGGGALEPNVKKGQESNCTIFETNYERIVGQRASSTSTRQDFQDWSHCTTQGRKARERKFNTELGLPSETKIVSNVKKGQESNCTIFETNYESIIGPRRKSTTTKQDYQSWTCGKPKNSSKTNTDGSDKLVPNVKKGQESNCTIFETNYDAIIGQRANSTSTRQDYQYWGNGNRKTKDQSNNPGNVKKGQESNCTIFLTNYAEVIGEHSTTQRSAYQNWAA